MTAFTLSQVLLLTVSAAAPSAITAPEVKVEGSASGKASAKVQTGMLLPGSDPSQETQLSFLAEVSTSDGAGVLGLFGSSTPSSLGAAWKLGLQMTSAFGLQTQSHRDPEAERVWKEAGFDACVQRCTDVPDAADKPFCDLRKKAQEEEVSRWRQNIVLMIPGHTELQDERLDRPQEWLPAQSFCAKQQEAARRAEETLEQALSLAGTDSSRRRAALSGALKDKAELVHKCLADCPGNSDAFCRNDTVQAVAEPKEVGADQIFLLNDSQLCPTGQGLVKGLRSNRRRSTFPSRQLTVGFKAGEDTQKFLAPGLTPKSFVPSTEYMVSWSAGGRYVHLLSSQDRTVSLEGVARITSGFISSSQTGRWCKDSGSVDGAQLQACREMSIGAPASSTDAVVGAFVGLIDDMDQRYRIAVGGEWKIPLLDGKHAFAASLPVTLNITAGGDKDYKGLVQVIPSLTWTRGDTGGRDITFGLSLALLGQRRLISEDFERP